MRKNTQLDETLCVIHPEPPLEGFSSLAVPVYRASTIVFPNAAAYRSRSARAPDGYTYGLSGTPTTRTLEAQLAAIHAAEHAIIVPSGQAAITAIMLTFLKKGDHLLVTDNVYPPVKQFSRDVLEGIGVETEYFDPTNLSDLKERLRPGRTRLVWLESPGSTTMEVCDIPAISRLANSVGALVGSDNTWATGLICKPLDLGVDFVAEALTKYVGGHSDILLGAMMFRDRDLYSRVRNTLSVLGIGVSPDECSLALRGMQTMALRLHHVGRVSEELAQRLSVEESINVLHPCLPNALGHAIWKRDFKGSSGVFSIRAVRVQTERVDRMLDSLETFAIGASWGGTRSLIAPMDLSDGRHVMKVDADSTYLRLSIGLEAMDDLWRDLQRVLDTLH